MTATTTGMCAADLQARIEDLTEQIAQCTRSAQHSSHGLTADRYGDLADELEAERDRLAEQGQHLTCPSCDGVGVVPAYRPDGTQHTAPCSLCCHTAGPHAGQPLDRTREQGGDFLVPEWVWEVAVEAQRQHAARERRDEARYDRRAKTGASDTEEQDL